MLRGHQFFTPLTSKCASRHNRVHFFGSSTSTSAPALVCFVRFDFEMCFAPQRRPLFQQLNFQECSGVGLFCTVLLRNLLRPTTVYTFSTAQLPKVLMRWCVLYGFTSKCGSRHNGVHFFDSSTSKSAPALVYFIRFDFEMCFAPQRRTLFRQLNFRKCSCVGVFCAVLVRNAVRATTACTFSTAQLPKVLMRWCVLYGFTSKCASRHNGVHFFISHLPRLLRTCRFSHKSLDKHSASRFFYLFAHLHLLSSDSFSSLIFFLLLFSSLTLPTSAFHLSILSEV